MMGLEDRRALGQHLNSGSVLGQNTVSKAQPYIGPTLGYDVDRVGCDITFGENCLGHRNPFVTF